MLNQRQNEIIGEFAIFDEWLDKYEFLIEMAESLPIIDPKHKNNNFLIEGCQSRVWIDAKINDKGLMEFTADSDAILTKGIIALLVKVLNNLTPKEVLEAELYFIDEIGLSQNLSPTRANGLVAMIKQMKLFALAFQNKADKS